MLSKLKQATETWLRGLIADEVSKLDRDLSNERASLRSTIAQLNASADRISELSYFKENAELRSHINDLTSQFAAVHDIINKLHPRL